MNATDLSVDRPPVGRGPIRRVGLISPYSGGNLGNATIISAVIANIGKRIPDAKILGITLSPDNTRRRHGIEAFPLAGISLPYYALVYSDHSETSYQQNPRAGRLKQWLKKIPVLGNSLRTVRGFGVELAHIVAAARVMRKLDCAMIPGGGALDEFWGGPWGHPWALFKWSLLSKIYRVPILFVSVGKSSLERPLSRFFVRNALRFADYRSYRDQESKIAVQALIDAPSDPVYPDLAFSYPHPNTEISSGDSPCDPLVVGVSPIAFCDPRSWPHRDEHRYAAYVGQLAEMVKWLLGEGHRVLFFTTDAPDIATVDDVRNRISRAVDASGIQTISSSAELGIDGFLKDIDGANLTIASRLHGVILSHLNNTPVLALSFDPKVDAHMSAIGQKEYCLDIDHLQLDILVERFNALKTARQNERARLQSATAGFRHLLDLQYDRILGASHSKPVTDDRYDNRIDALPVSQIGGSRAG